MRNDFYFSSTSKHNFAFKTSMTSKHLQKWSTRFTPSSSEIKISLPRWARWYHNLTWNKYVRHVNVTLPIYVNEIGFFGLKTSINNEFIALIKIASLWWTFSRHAIDITTAKLKTKTTRKNPRRSTAREFEKSCLEKSWNILQHGTILFTLKICNFAVFVKSGKYMLLFNIKICIKR